MDESVIPQTSQYYFYSRGIIGVIVHGHVIKRGYIMGGFVYVFADEYRPHCHRLDS